MSTFTLPNYDVATAHLCRNCLGKGVTRSVATMAGRPVVILTLVCQACGHQWTIERASQTSLDQSHTADS
jgi:hypothetical protein